MQKFHQSCCLIFVQRVNEKPAILQILLYLIQAALGSVLVYFSFISKLAHHDAMFAGHRLGFFCITRSLKPEGTRMRIYFLNNCAHINTHRSRCGDYDLSHTALHHTVTHICCPFWLLHPPLPPLLPNPFFFPAPATMRVIPPRPGPRLPFLSVLQTILPCQPKWTEFLRTLEGSRDARQLAHFYYGVMSSEPQMAC